MSEKKCPECGCGRDEYECLECSSYFYQERFVQSLTCRLRVAEARIETLQRERDDYKARWQGVMDKAMDTFRELDAAKQRIEVVPGERDNWKDLYDDARKRIAALKESVATYQQSAAYWWVSFYNAKGLNPPYPCASDEKWAQVMTGAVKANERIAELEATLEREIRDRKIAYETVVAANGNQATTIGELQATIKRLNREYDDATHMYRLASSETQQAVEFLKNVLVCYQSGIRLKGQWIDKVSEFVEHLSTPQFLPCCKACGVPTPKRYMRGEVCMPCRMKVERDDARDTNVELQKLADAHAELKVECERLRGGREWWIVERIQHLSPLVFLKEIDAATFAVRNYAANGDPIHVREVLSGPAVADVGMARQYNRTLTPDEVKAIYEQELALMSQVRDLGGEWFTLNVIGG